MTRVNVLAFLGGKNASTTTGLIWELPNLETCLTGKLAKLGKQPLITNSYVTVAVTTS